MRYLTMKKKKNLFLLLGIIGLLFTTSCKNFIKEVNKSNISANNYYTNQTGYTSLMNSMYAQLRTLYGNSDDVWMYCAGTDMYWQGSINNSDEQALSSYESLTPSNGLVDQYYTDSYHAIQVANTAIYYNSRTASSPNLKSDLGEAQFLRSLFYFNLVRFFGGVSLTTKRINHPILSFKRAPADSVYLFIINQMQDALKEVPQDNKPGKVNKRTVNFFLSKVNLRYAWWLTNPFNIPNTNRKDPAGHDSKYYFQQAVKYADAAIQGQPLNDITFANEWYPGNENNPNVIFSVQYSSSSVINPKDDGNDQNYFFSPYLGGEGATLGYPYRSHSLLPDPYLFSLYTQYDTRLSATFMLTHYQEYYDFYKDHSNLKGVKVKYYYVPIWEEKNVTSWKNAAPAQRDSAIVIPEQNWAPGYTFNGYEGAPVPPSVKKFDDPSAPFAGNGSTRNIVLARLAEAYLIKAEAEYKLGNYSEAATAINVVRDRAAETGHQSDMSVTAAQLSGTGANQGINLILNERARELVGEYKRWFDLTRTGQLMIRDKKYNRNVQAWVSGGTDPFGTGPGQYKLLRPIPQKAIDLNHAKVQQNQGY